MTRRTISNCQTCQYNVTILKYLQKYVSSYYIFFFKKAISFPLSNFKIEVSRERLLHFRKMLQNIKLSQFQKQNPIVTSNKDFRETSRMMPVVLSICRRAARPAFTCLKSTIETPEECVKSKLSTKARQRSRSDAFTFNSEPISHIVLVFQFLTLNK